jgi:dynein heavy chain
MINVCKTHLGEEYFNELPQEPFFVDFLRDAPEPTGEESEDASLDAPKIYEQVNFLNVFVECPYLFFLCQL